MPRTRGFKPGKIPRSNIVPCYSAQARLSSTSTLSFVLLKRFKLRPQDSRKFRVMRRYSDTSRGQWQPQEDMTPGLPYIKAEVTPAEEAVFYNQTAVDLPPDSYINQTGLTPGSVFGAGAANTEFQPFTGGPAAMGLPALDFNGYILHAAPRPVPEELQRDSTGASIAEPDAILDEENGRTYHNYHDGRYYLPNDPVCISNPGFSSSSRHTLTALNIGWIWGK